ncbi:hypothetical protein KCU81_g767, partial [Aureobasidium melanogenum]
MLSLKTLFFFFVVVCRNVLNKAESESITTQSGRPKTRSSLQKMVWSQSRKPSSVSEQRYLEEMPARPIRSREMVDGVDLATIPAPQSQDSFMLHAPPRRQWPRVSRDGRDFKQVCAQSEHDCGTR